MSEAIPIRSWQAPIIAGPGARSPEDDRLDPEAIEAIKKEAYAEGFEAGRRDGEAKGLALTQDRADGFFRLLEGIDEPLRYIDAQLAEQLAEFAAVIAAEMTRGLITLEVDKLVDLILQLSETLPSDQHPPRLYLNPQDRTLVAEYVGALDEGHPLKSWPLFDEPSLERGESRIQGSYSAIRTDLIERARSLALAAIRGRDEA